MIKQHPGRATIIKAVLSRHYSRVLRLQWNASKGWRKHFLIEVAKIIRREAATLLKPDTSLSLCQDITLPNIQAFSWDSTLAAIEKAAPLTFSAVRAIATSRKNEESLVTPAGKSLKPIIVNALSCLLRGRHRDKVKFIPSLNSMQLRKNGVKSMGLSVLSKTGTCLRYESTMNVIEKISSRIDDAVRAYTNSVRSESAVIHSDFSKGLEQEEETNENADNMDSDDDKVNEDDLEDQISEDDLEDQVSEDDLEDQVSGDDLEEQVSEDDLEDQVSEDDLEDQVNGDDLEDQVSEDDLEDQVNGDDLEDQVSEDDLEDQISEDDLKDQVSEDDLENQVAGSNVGQVSEDNPEDRSENENIQDGPEDEVFQKYLYNVDGDPLGKVNLWNTEVDDLLMTCENDSNNGHMIPNKVRNENKKLKGSNNGSCKDNG